MVDLLGNELHVGDAVVFAHANYTSIQVGKIVKFGTTQVILDHCYGWGKRKIVHESTTEHASYRKRIQRYPQDVVKVSVNED